MLQIFILDVCLGSGNASEKCLQFVESSQQRTQSDFFHRQKIKRKEDTKEKSEHISVNIFS